MAFANVIKESGIRCIGHHHDFYWERDNFSQPTCSFVRQAMEEYYPPKDDLISHVVINSIVQKELKAKRNCVKNNKKIYSLWDIYLFADIITYPSIQEGWGKCLTFT